MIRVNDCQTNPMTARDVEAIDAVVAAAAKRMAPPPMTLSLLLFRVTRRALLRSLRLAHGNRGAAACALGLPPRTFQRILATHVTPDELATLAQRHGWPTRAELAANARAARPCANA